MGPVAPKKPRITLADYNYQRDIQNRMVLGQCNTTDIEIVEEILNGSLSFSLKALADTLNISLSAVSHTVGLLEKIDFLRVKGEQAIADKDIRRYLEIFIEKFQPSFEPNLDFFQRILSKVPIDVLPNWYAIPRTSDNIIMSIVERHFITPKNFEKHLEEVKEEFPILKMILEEVYKPPHFFADVKSLREKLKISPEAFAELILILEYEFACVSRFVKEGKQWKEILIPFVEWRDYLNFLYINSPVLILDKAEIKRQYSHDFGFVENMTLVLEELLKPTPKKLKKKQAENELPEMTERMEHYFKALSVIQNEKGRDHIDLQTAESWLKKPIQDRAISLYASTIGRFRCSKDPRCPKFTERDIREAEKALKKIHHSGWVDLESFLKGVTTLVGTTQNIYLHIQGKRSHYKLPRYEKEDVDFIRSILTTEFTEAGLIAVGSHKGRTSICVTPFGRMTLGE